jgi:hypothetical protein
MRQRKIKKIKSKQKKAQKKKHLKFKLKLLQIQIINPNLKIKPNHNNKKEKRKINHKKKVFNYSKNLEPKKNVEEDEGEWVQVTKKSRHGLNGPKDSSKSKKTVEDDEYLDQF